MAMEGILAAAAAVTAVAGAIAAIVQWAVRPAIRTARRVADFLDDWNGEVQRPGVPARPGVMTRIGRLQTRLDAVEHQLHPNSGESLRDAVDETQRLVRGAVDNGDLP